jgi:hypothetical protein
MPLTKAEARKIALSFPGTTEGSHFRQPAIYLNEKFFTRVHHKEDAMVILTGSLEMRDVMLEAEPELFFITDHYRNFPALLARLSKLDRKTLKELLTARVLRIAEKAAKKKAKKRVAKKATKKKGSPKSIRHGRP